MYENKLFEGYLNSCCKYFFKQKNGICGFTKEKIRLNYCGKECAYLAKQKCRAKINKNIT